MMTRRLGANLSALAVDRIRIRRRTGARSFQLAVFFGALLVSRAAKSEPRTASTAQTDDDDGAAYVVLIAPDGCGTREALMAGIKKQSERVHFVERGQARRALFAEIRAIGGRGFTAGFTLLRSTGRLSQRQIIAKTCSEALDALTLLATLALDPREDDKLGSDSNVTTDATAETSPASVPEPTKLEAAPDHSAAPMSPAAGAGETFWTLAAGAGGLATWGPSPSTMPGVLLYAGIGWSGREPLTPSLRISASHVGREGIMTQGGTAGFALDLVGLDVCPLGVARFGLNLRACAAGTLGQLSAHGSDTRLPANLHRPFGTLGGMALLSFEPGLRIEITATIAASAPLVRDSFQFRSDVFFRVRPVTVTAGLGIGFRIL